MLGQSLLCRLWESGRAVKSGACSWRTEPVMADADDKEEILGQIIYWHRCSSQQSCSRDWPEALPL